MAIRTETRQARELARYLDHAVHELRKSNGDPARKWQEWLDIDDPHIGEAVVAELREMLRERPDISERDTLERALEQRRHSREMLWRLLS
jgi:hypothetical protein